MNRRPDARSNRIIGRLPAASLPGFGAVLSVVLAGCASLSATPDPKALNTPLYMPFANAETVIVEVISVNGVQAPPQAFASAIEDFRGYLVGGLRIVEGRPVELDLGEDGALTRQQFNSILAGRQHREPSAVTLILCPDLDFYGGVGEQSMSVRTNGELLHHIKISAKDVESLELFPGESGLEKAWHFALLHELCHTFQLPSDRSRRCYGGHCTNPDCVIYPVAIAQSEGLPLPKSGPSATFCRNCRNELRTARDAAQGGLFRLSDEYTALDLANGFVELNPGEANLYAQRGDVKIRMRDTDGAIRDYETALQLDPHAWPLFGGLARILATTEDESYRDPDRALELATLACELSEWRDHASLDVLAKVYAVTGDFESAIEYERKAIKLAGALYKMLYHERLQRLLEEKASQKESR